MNNYLKPEKYIIEKTSGEIKVEDEITYIPAHERENVEKSYNEDNMTKLLDEVETALLEGGNAEAFDKIEELRNKVEKE